MLRKCASQQSAELRPAKALDTGLDIQNTSLAPFAVKVDRTKLTKDKEKSTNSLVIDCDIILLYKQKLSKLERIDSWAQ